ncbi:hypothetical protein X777_08122 [Ooceraea biroi]|uniref:BESS domain-containing protein n=1 Tax=Ooceraea biroi TaxID=2015173 RepID=A0A026WC80_OOCBI|nr:hypothetical protein X777_08122 [Ooceraea biroi]
MVTSVCKARWNNIRDNYRKSLKKQRLGADKQLSFLKKYFEERETKGNIENQEEEQDKQEYERQEENNEHENNGNEIQNRKDAEKLDDVHDNSQSQAPSISNLKIKKPHPVDAFLAGVAPSLKTLSPYYLHLAKSEIFAIVQKYEMKKIME